MQLLSYPPTSSPATSRASSLLLLLFVALLCRDPQRPADDLGPQAARATHGPSAAMGTALAQRPG